MTQRQTMPKGSTLWAMQQILKGRKVRHGDWEKDQYVCSAGFGLKRKDGSVGFVIGSISYRGWKLYEES